MPTDPDAPAARALRGLQQIDQLVSLDEHRPLLTRAQDALGEELGLRCTGAPEGDGHYAHDGGTCPIHEWLVPADAEGLERRA